MADISVQNLTKYYGDRLILQGLTFDIQPGEKVAILGANGAGKTTLLNILTGRLPYDGGSVSLGAGKSAGIIDQMPDFPANAAVEDVLRLAFRESDEIIAALQSLTAEMAHRPDDTALLKRYAALETRLDALGGYNRDYEIDQVCNGLDIPSDMRAQKFALLSGGEKTRVNLARIILEKTDILLLDEPTNHLDIESIGWLETFIATRANAVILVSHDRAFINNTTFRTIEIELGRIYDYKVKYSEYVELRKERREQQLRAYENQQKKLADTEAFIERFRYKATKSVQVQSRIKQLEKVDRIEVDEVDTAMLSLKFPPAPRSGSYPVIIENVAKRYGDHLIFEGATLTINRGDKVAFVGKNGEGKSTLVKCIMGEIDFTGKLQLGHNVKIGYFAQNQAQLLDENRTVFETIDYVAQGDIRTKIRDILGAFMFGGEASDKKVKVLSGGERSRLAMIRLLLEPVNLLILDEPTNHLDMRSKDVLKEALAAFDGTVIVVSHDREFLDGLVDKVYEFGNRRVTEHLGGIYAFLEHKKMENLNELERTVRPAASAAAAGTAAEGTAAASASSKLSYEARKEQAKAVKKAERAVAEAESRIDSLEKEVATLEIRMATPEGAADAALYTDYSRLKKELADTMDRWTELTLEWEALAGENS